jgi:hypothetical protein
MAAQCVYLVTASAAAARMPARAVMVIGSCVLAANKYMPAIR